jgi:quinol monooxygenase YgiN
MASSVLGSQMTTESLFVGGKPMVQMTVRLTATTGRTCQLIEALHALMRQTRVHSGCTDAHIAADVDEADAFWYCEDWDSAQALESEIRTHRFSQLLELMESSPSTPTLEFRVISETRGLEYVTAVRGQGPFPPVLAPSKNVKN